MPPAEPQLSTDAVVIGAGLAGLVAAVRLQQLGRQVLLVERNDAVGGLCRTVELHGLPYPVGCNDFGAGLRRRLLKLGVDIPFTPARTRFLFDQGPIQLPPDAGTLWRLLPRLPDLFRLYRAGKARPLGHLCALGRELGLAPATQDLLHLLPYAQGASDLALSSVAAIGDKSLDYGLDKSEVPVGGPGAITQALAARFAELGGELRLGVQAEALGGPVGSQEVRLGEERLRVHQVITSAPRWSAYPDLPRGLGCASFHLALPQEAWPKGLHALGFMPGPVARWVQALEAGQQPEAFGFHAFCSDQPAVDGLCAVTGFFFLPRGREEPDAAARALHEAALDEGLERCVPGIVAATRHRTVLYPEEYRQRVGCEPWPGWFQLPPGFTKPPQLDPETGLLHVGNSVQPPGEHAVGAALSGWLAADTTHASLEAL